jgi:hemerythrin-like metal-binding protein
MTWNEALVTGIPDLDDQHRSAFQQIALLAEAGSTGATAYDAAVRTVEGLKAHVGAHFDYEEALMRESGCPEIEAHVAEHAEIRAYVASFAGELAASSARPDLLVAATRVLANWLQSHIQTHDRDLATHLRQHGRQLA